MYRKENSGLVFESGEQQSEIKTIEEAEIKLQKGIERIGGVEIEEGSTRMGVSSIRELYTLAKEAQQEFTDTIINLSKELGLDEEKVSYRTELKKFSRVIEKTLSDYTGDIGRVLDVNGATFTLNNINEATEIYEKAVALLGDSIVKKKAHVGDDGYRDFKINFKTSNGFVGELIILDKATMWEKDKGIGHDIYNVTRALNDYNIDDKNKQKYGEVFSKEVLNSIEKLNNDLKEWSKKAYTNAEALMNGQYDNEGFNANLYAISSDITELSAMLRRNLDLSYSVGESAYTLPSEVRLSMDNSRDSSSLLNAVSQISKYLTDIVNSYTTNIIQNNLTYNSTEFDTGLLQVAETSNDPNTDSNGLIFTKVVNHGTTAIFDRFDSSHAYEGDGSATFGAGNYVTESTDIAKDYARRAQRKNTLYRQDSFFYAQELNTKEEEIKALKDKIEKENLSGWRKTDVEFWILEKEKEKAFSLNAIRSEMLKNLFGENLTSQEKEEQQYAFDYLRRLTDNEETELDIKEVEILVKLHNEILTKINNGEIYPVDGKPLSEQILLPEYGDLLSFSPFRTFVLSLNDFPDSPLNSPLKDLQAIREKVLTILAVYKERIEDYRGFINYNKNSNHREEYKYLDDIVDDIVSAKIDPEELLYRNAPKRQLYKVDIPDDGYLDWDKDINESLTSEQMLSLREVLIEQFGKKKANKILSTNGAPIFNGEVLYGRISKAFNNQAGNVLSEREYKRLTSNLLHKAGFVGNEYLAGRYFGGFDNIKNYVIFNDDDLKILNRYEYMTNEEGAKYTKNIEYTYAQGSVLVPYTTEQIIGRIRQGKPVEASHLQTLLDSNKDNASFNKSYRAIIQKELSAIRILTANPVLNRTIPVFRSYHQKSLGA